MILQLAYAVEKNDNIVHELARVYFRYLNRSPWGDFYRFLTDDIGLDNLNLEYLRVSKFGHISIVSVIDDDIAVRLKLTFPDLWDILIVSD